MTRHTLSPRQAAVLREAFIDMVTTLNVANTGNPDWWLTWLSSRDRFRPRLWDDLADLARFAALKERGDLTWPQDATVPVALVLHAWRGLRKPSLPRRLLSMLSDAWMFAKIVALACCQIAAARRNPIRQTAEPVDVIIATILGERALTRGGPYDDVYFGRLHEHLAAAGRRAIYCGFPEGNADRILAAAAARSDVSIVGYAHLLNFYDVARAAVRVLAAHFTVPVLPLPWGADARPLVVAELRRERCSIFEGTLIRWAMERLLARYPGARLINMFENNGWERANYQAAKAAGRPVTGYLHCSILRSHLKNRFPREEHSSRPMPDRVVTTGEAARDLLLEIGDYPTGLVLAGCGLRSPLLSQIAALPKFRQPARTVLAVFEGLISVVPAMQLFEQVAKARPDLRFLVRCHPQLPIEALSSASGVPYGPGAAVHVSQPVALGDAIAEADVVAYVGSTAVLFALYGGRPVVKMDIDDTVDDDPLTACPAFKWRARNVVEFECALQEINATPAEAAEQQMAQARRYLESYVREPQGAALEPLLRDPRTL